MTCDSHKVRLVTVTPLSRESLIQEIAWGNSHAVLLGGD